MAAAAKPAPVVLGRWVRKTLAEMAILDIQEPAEHLIGCADLDQLFASLKLVEEQVAWVRILTVGTLADWHSVEAAQNLIGDQQERVKNRLGELMINLAIAREGRPPGDPGVPVARPSVLLKRIRRNTKKYKRLRAAWLECSRFGREYLDISRDEEARDRLARSGGAR